MSMLSSLEINKASRKSPKRLGRGHGSGHGKTSSKGHKGQKARSGGRVPPGFEGGQTPVMRRLPKFGFTNAKFRNRYEILNLNDLDRFGDSLTPEVLFGENSSKKLKVLGRGEVKKAIHVKAHRFSESAKKAIEAAGGQVEVLETESNQKKANEQEKTSDSTQGS